MIMRLTIRWPLPVAGSLVLVVAWSALAQGSESCFEGICAFDECHTPARSVPGEFWDELEPSDAILSQLPENRDNSSFNQLSFFGCDRSYFEALDVENGWLFVVTNRGFQIWDATTEARAGQPVRLTHQCSDLADLHPVPRFPAEKFAFRDVDAPQGVDSVVATALAASAGIVIWDTNDKGQPFPVYQHAGLTASEVYSTSLGERHYTLAAIENAGLLLFDMTAALDQPLIPCVDEPFLPPCEGILLGRVGERTRAGAVDGTLNPDSGRHHVAFTGIAPEPGLEVWDVTDPAAPVRRLTDSEELLFGIALWHRGGAHYLAVQALQEQRIYADPGGCLDGSAVGECSLADLELVWQGPKGAGVRRPVTYSEDDLGTPYLHFGVTEPCSTDEAEDRLYDVTNPSAPRPVASDAYWNFYHRTNETGFNWVAPRMGKFAGDHFYRAGFGLLDSHRRRVQLEILHFQAQSCTRRVCVGEVGVPVIFSLETEGPVDTYEYDWEGDGTFEVVSVVPVTSHIYEMFGAVQPVVRLRDARGAAVDLQHSPKIIIFDRSMPGPPGPPPGPGGRELGVPKSPVP